MAETPHSCPVRRQLQSLQIECKCGRRRGSAQVGYGSSSSVAVHQNTIVVCFGHHKKELRPDAVSLSSLDFARLDCLLLLENVLHPMFSCRSRNALLEGILSA